LLPAVIWAFGKVLVYEPPESKGSSCLSIFNCKRTDPQAPLLEPGSCCCLLPAPAPAGTFSFNFRANASDLLVVTSLTEFRRLLNNKQIYYNVSHMCGQL
jgi:hypothetical protein